MQAFSHSGNCVIKTVFVPTVYHVATEELGKVYARVQSERPASCMVLHIIAHVIVDDIRELALIVTCTRTIGDPLAMEFSISNGALASHNINYMFYWLQDSVAAQQKYWIRLQTFFESDFGGAHPALLTAHDCVCVTPLRYAMYPPPVMFVAFTLLWRTVPLSMLYFESKGFPGGTYT
jgi:hypothetical protein